MTWPQVVVIVWITVILMSHWIKCGDGTLYDLVVSITAYTIIFGPLIAALIFGGFFK